MTNHVVKVLCLWSSARRPAIVSKVLERDGGPFDLITAESLAAFREQSVRNEFDAGLIEYRALPGRAKAQREFLESLEPRLPLVLLVSERGEENALRILKGGVVQDYVVKSMPRVERLPFALRSAASQRAESSGQQALQMAKDIERRLTALLENSADAIVVVGMGGEIKFKTDAVARVLGYSAQEMTTVTIFDLAHPEDFGAILQIFSGLTQVVGASLQAEFRLRAKDGSWHWVEATAKNLFDDPQVAGIVVNYCDIHKRKQAEILQDAVYRIAQTADFALSLHELYPRIHAIISEVMPAGNFYIALASSPRGYLSFPYFVDEMDNAPVGEQAENGLTEYVLRTGRPMICDENQQKDMALGGEVDVVGATSKVWLGVPLVVNGSAIGVMAVQHYQDSHAYGEREQRMLEFVSSQVALVIKRKQAEDALRASEEGFRSLFENSTIGIVRTTPEGRILLANPALVKMLRFGSLEDLRERNLQEEGFALEHPRSEFLSQFETKDVIHGYESTWMCKDGSLIYVRESSRAVRDPHGNIQYFEGVVEDITEQKRAAASLQEKVAALQALAAIDRDILAAREAMDILELVCRSAASLLKAPMAAIISTRKGDWKLEATFGIESPEAVGIELREMAAKGIRTQPASFSVEAVSANSPMMPQFLHREGIHSVLAENLAVDTVQRGILLVFDITPRVWNGDDKGLLKALAGQSAIALEKARLLSDAERRGDEFAALYNVSRGLSGEREVGTILSLIVDSVIQLLKSPSAFIYLYDEKREVLNLSVVRGIEFAPNLTLSLGEGMAGRVAVNRKPLFVNDYQGWTDKIASLDHIPYASILEVPMLFGGKLIGVLGIAEVGTNSRVISEEETSLLMLFAGQAASAVYSARLFDEIQKSNQELERLYRASDALIGAVAANVGEMSRKIAQIMVSEFQQANCSLWLISRDSPRLQRRAFEGSFTTEFIERTLMLDGQGLIPKAIRLGQVINSADVFSDSDYVAGWPSARSELVVPLISGERVIGALDVQSPEPSAFCEDDVRMMSLFASKASLMLEHARLVTETEQSMKRLSALHTVDVAIASSLDLQVTLKVFLEQVTSQLRVDAADVLLINPHLQLLEYAAGRGFRGMGASRVSLIVGEDAAGQAVLERSIVGLTDLTSPRVHLSHPERIAGEGFVSVYAVPLIARGRIKGVLELYFRSQFSADYEWEDFVETLARQAALAIDDAHLFEQLQHSYTELSVAYDGTIAGWARLLELRNIEPEGHAHIVTALVMDLARQMGVPEQELVHIYRGAMLHDIGKLAIPDAILLKPGGLLEEEKAIIRTHPVFAYDLLSSIEYLRPAAHIPHSHHEKWDGSGYPRGLKGEDIPLAARIFSVVNVWDTLQRERPYQPAWSEVDAIAFIRERAGQDFDPQVVETFLALLREMGK